MDTFFRIYLVAYGTIGVLVLLGILIHDYRRGKESVINFLSGISMLISAVGFIVAVAFWPAVLLFYFIELYVAKQPPEDKKPRPRMRRTDGQGQVTGGRSTKCI